MSRREAGNKKAREQEKEGPEIFSSLLTNIKMVFYCQDVYDLYFIRMEGYFLFSSEPGFGFPKKQKDLDFLIESGGWADPETLQAVNPSFPCRV